MSTFTLAIFCLTTSNLPWFDLTFQVPMQYCSLQHWTLLLSPVTSTTGYCFCFGSIPSFFLELFLHWSPVAYWAPTDLGSSSFSILSFCLFILCMRFSWNGRDLTEAEDIKKRWQEYTEDLYKKDLHNPDNHNGMITHLEPDILECEVKWALGSITTNKASGGDGIPVELFQTWKMMLWKCCTQYASKFGKLSSGCRTRKVQFSFQSQGKAMPKNAQTTTQLHSSHTLVN